MIFRKYKFEKENGTTVLRYCVDEHKAQIFSEDLLLEEEHDLERKLELIRNFLEYTRMRIKPFTEKETLKAFGKVDEQIAEYYKSKFPRGGSRENAGRKQGSTQTKPKSQRTERFTQALTKEENEFLKEVLLYYRTDQEKIQKALIPFIRQIEAKFGDDVEGLEKWRRRMANTNPAMLVYTLEHFALWGIEDLIPIGLKKAKRK